MPIKLLLEIIGTIVALVSCAIAVKAFLELRKINRSQARRHQAIPHEETEQGIRRAS